MILTCPSCDTRYFADAANLGAKDRAVRCASCSHVWRARAEDVASPPRREDDHDPMGDIGDLSDPDAPLSAPPRRRARAEPRRGAGVRASWLRVAAVAWGGLAVAFVGLAGAAFAFRVSIVEIWPQTASAYAMVGMETVAGGLVFEDVSGERGFSEGSGVLIVTATVRNTTRRVRALPPVRVSLRDQGGAEVLGRVVTLDHVQLGPNEMTRLRTEIARPPSSAQELELTFEESAASAAALDTAAPAEAEEGAAASAPPH